jgi:Concanavalin A-like lectin/glucanases superfamily
MSGSYELVQPRLVEPIRSRAGTRRRRRTSWLSIVLAGGSLFEQPRSLSAAQSGKQPSRKIVSLSLRRISLAVVMVPVMLCGRSEAQVPISYGQTVFGSVGSAGEVLTYTFTANATDTVDVAMTATSGSLVPEIKIYGSGPNPVCTAAPGFCSGGEAEIAGCSLPAGGTYTIVVDDCGNAKTGAFSLYLGRQNSAADAVPIAAGQTLAAAIDAPAEKDALSFAGTAGDLIVLAMTATSGGLVPEIRVFDPSGTQVCSAAPGFCSGGEVETAPCALTTSGTYTIFVDDCGNRKTGNYDLYLQRLNAPGGASAIGFGETVSANVSKPAQKDTYTFVASAGDIVGLALTTTSGTLVPELRVYGPNGTQVCAAAPGFCSGGEAEIGSCTLATAGTYTVLVDDCGNRKTGDYDLYVQRLNNPGAASPIAFGQTVSSSIGTSAQKNAYTFSASAGDLANLVMTATSGSLVPEIRVLRPNGVQACGAAPGFCSGSTVEILPCALPDDGSYTVLIDDCGNRKTGDYDLYLQRLNAPGNASPITPGVATASSITLAGEKDTYTLVVGGGGLVNLRMATTSGSVVPQLAVYDAAGTQLCAAAPGFCSGSAIEIQDCLLPSAGTFTILADDCGNTKTGDYELRLTCITAACVALSTPTATTPLLPTPSRTPTATPTRTSIQPATRVALLVRDSSSLDPDESNVKEFLDARMIEYTIIDSDMLASGTIDLGDYPILYMRTGATPSAYDNPAVVSKIETRIESGAKLILEYYGLYLGEYLGVGTASPAGWGPVVQDASYYVGPIANSDLLGNIPVWSPPVPPDNASQLIAQLKQPGGYSYVAFTFNAGSQFLDYWLLHTTYGWSNQSTDSNYCVEHAGLCTGERSVHGTDLIGRSLEFISVGQGAVYRLGLGVAQLTPANNVVFGPIASLLRENVIAATQITAPTSTRTPTLTATPTSAATRTPTPIPTPTRTPTRTPSFSPTVTGTLPPTPAGSGTVTATPTPTPTGSPGFQLRVGNTNLAPGQQGAPIPILLTNNTNVRGVQFTLTDVPDEVSLSAAPECSTASRGSGLSCTCNQTDNTIVCVLISTGSARIAPGSGQIATVFVDDATPSCSGGETIQLNLSETALADDDNNPLAHTDVNGSLHCGCGEDLNCDANVDIFDALICVDLVLGRNPARCADADLDSNGRTDIFDCLLIVDTILGRRPACGACIEPPSGLISWWPGEGDAADVIDGNTGVLSGGVSFVAGEVGQAFDFDGTGAITIADDPSLNPSAVTIEGWIRPQFSDRPRVPCDIDTVLAKFAPGSLGSGYGLAIVQDPACTFADETGPLAVGTVGFAVVSTANGYHAVHSSGQVPNDGAYHHVAGTYDGTLMEVYIDGALQGQKANGGALVPSGVAASIGYDNSTPRNSVAALDEVALYNRALSQEEIQTIVAAGHAGKCPQ